MSFDERYVWGSLIFDVEGGSVITLEQKGEKKKAAPPPPPPALECSGLNVKQHYLLVIGCLYFENLSVSRNANNGIYLKYTPCFCMLPPGGFGYPKKKTPLFTYFSPHYNMDFQGP